MSASGSGGFGWLAATQLTRSLSKSMDSNTEEIDRLNAAIAAAKASVGNMDSQVRSLQRT